eukprot:GHVS01107523.1.p1 GENE.GHVS01107523.1~~GHVS01107523.1.p1  ORF type:complete len:312 (+),score=28.56 GHVS01107523.1:131-937(+)
MSAPSLDQYIVSIPPKGKGYNFGSNSSNVVVKVSVHKNNSENVNEFDVVLPPTSYPAVKSAAVLEVVASQLLLDPDFVYREQLHSLMLQPKLKVRFGSDKYYEATKLIQGCRQAGQDGKKIWTICEGEDSKIKTLLQTALKDSNENFILNIVPHDRHYQLLCLSGQMEYADRAGEGEEQMWKVITDTAAAVRLEDGKARALLFNETKCNNAREKCAPAGTSCRLHVRWLHSNRRLSAYRDLTGEEHSLVKQLDLLKVGEVAQLKLQQG